MLKCSLCFATGAFKGLLARIVDPLLLPPQNGGCVAFEYSPRSAHHTHRTFGLTTAVFAQNTDIQLNVVDDRGHSRACGTPRVRIELSMQAVIVYVASELATQPCQHDVTLSHEMKHVEVFREALEIAARDLARDFPVAIGIELRQARNPDELQQRFVVSLRNYLAQFMRDRERMLDESQAAVDSPEEYARVSTACPQS